jgi:hypothetical protein
MELLVLWRDLCGVGIATKYFVIIKPSGYKLVNCRLALPRRECTYDCPSPLKMNVPRLIRCIKNLRFISGPSQVPPASICTHAIDVQHHARGNLGELWCIHVKK